MTSDHSPPFAMCSIRFDGSHTVPKPIRPNPIPHHARPTHSTPLYSLNSIPSIPFPSTPSHSLTSILSLPFSHVPSLTSLPSIPFPHFPSPLHTVPPTSARTHTPPPLVRAVPGGVGWVGSGLRCIAEGSFGDAPHSRHAHHTRYVTRRATANPSEAITFRRPSPLHPRPRNPPRAWPRA